MPDLDIATLRDLTGSWLLTLRAERKSPQTLKQYGDGVRFYLDYCEAEAMPPLLRATLTGWVNALLEKNKPATARSRQLAVRRFSAWLADPDAGDEIGGDPFAGMKPPKLDETEIQPLSDEELRDLLKACRAPRDATATQKLRHVRDEAIIRLMLESTIRAGELVALALDDVNTLDGVAVIRRGKGGKERRVPFGDVAGQAIDKYIRLRRHHRLAESPMLWLGDRGKGFTYDALHKTLALRADEAGIVGFHPHRLRHTAAHRWLAAGGSESGLQAVAGWTRPDMLHRYTKARATDRALDEARKLNLGDL